MRCEARGSLLLERYNLDAQDLLFIDDRADNIAAAEKLGFHGHVFENPEKLRAALQKYDML